MLMSSLELKIRSKKKETTLRNVNTTCSEVRIAHLMLWRGKKRSKLSKSGREKPGASIKGG